MKTINVIALILIIVGALNWGLVGFFKFDLVSFLFGGPASVASRVIYGVIGIAGLYGLSFFRHFCCCSDSKNDSCCKK